MNVKQSYLRTGMIETEMFVDVDSGEILETNVKKHTYIANSKEEFLLLYSSVLGIFNKMEQSEIRVFSYLLQYADGTKFSIDKPMRLEIASTTELNERTVYNTVKKLTEKNLIFKYETGAYQINPRYAYKGSSINRNNALKAIIELGCKEC